MSAPKPPAPRSVPAPAPAYGRTSGFGDRLRTYLIGVGIGAMLLGTLWMMKNRAAQQQRQQGEAAPADSTPAPAPREPTRSGQ